MRRWLCLTWIAAAALGAGGCATGPLQDNPLAVHTEMPLVAENPAYVPLIVELPIPETELVLVDVRVCHSEIPW